MKLFRCDNCGNLLYFENVRCEQCGRALGYEPGSNTLPSLVDGPDVWTAPALGGKQFVYCANAQFGACNWLVPHEPGGDPFCLACRHNEVVPPTDNAEDVRRWQIIERAKKRLFYSLLRLQLPLATRAEDPEHGLAFRFLDEEVAPEPVMTGHDRGIITIALSEADDAARESRRTQFNEPYRTMLGHFRHEIGHHYWDLLVDGTEQLQPFRDLFGDERADYGEALQSYYANGAPDGWQQHHISAYATAHPWEDFAETFAHYFHVVDTTETAAAFGVSLSPPVDRSGDLSADVRIDPYRPVGMDELMAHWIPLSALINNLNRSVGQNDAYPFVLTPQVIAKLGFIDRLVHRATS